MVSRCGMNPPITDPLPVDCPVDRNQAPCEPLVYYTQKHANEIETLLNIQQVITSHLDLSDVLQMIVNEARRLTTAKLSFLYVLEDEYLCLAAVSGSDQSDQLLGYRVPVEKSLAGRSIQTNQPIMLTDVHQDDARIYEEAIKPFGNVGCYLTVPLIYENRSIGVIAVADQCNGALGNDSLRVLSMLAPSAVIGIENARLYQEQQERRLEAESRHQMSESLRVMLAIVNSNRSLTEILEFIVSQVSGRLFDCQATAVFSYQPKEKSLLVQAAYGLPSNMIDAQFLPGYEAASQAIHSGQPVIVSDSRTGGADDASNYEGLPAELALLTQMIVEYQAWLAVPLIVKGEMYGSILMYYQEPHLFSSEEINLAKIFSDQVALAIENARLRFQAEQAAVIGERNRLARELHDAVSQTLFSANLIAEIIPRLWEKDQDQARLRLLELHQLTRGALAEMRTLLFELRPAVFKEAKLADLLKHLIQAIAVRSEIPISLKVSGDEILPADVQIALYRITQEALNNVIKHANPSQASVNLAVEPGAAQLIVSDDGCGFDLSQVSPDHFGLSIMKERATSINASIEMKSQPGLGTQIVVIWNENSKQE